MAEVEHCKKCYDCQEIKPLDAFHRNSQDPSGRVRYCKECMRQRYLFRRYGTGVDRRRRRDLGPDEKWCPRCSQALPKTAFGRNASKKSGLTAYCASCHNELMRDNRIKIEGSTRNYHLKRRYGLTEDDVEQLIAQQGGVCAVCRTGEPEHVDHCHRTGKVRGVLCFNCNGGLGQFKDDIDRLINAIAYLEEKSWIEPVEPVGSPPSI
ncbi:MAG: hypothetical protein QOC80_1370 [Frankiaceae bacterium]|nr:hypothetical protein [Frankiaceae bacterium]